MRETGRSLGVEARMRAFARPPSGSKRDPDCLHSPQPSLLLGFEGVLFTKLFHEPTSRNDLSLLWGVGGDWRRNAAELVGPGSTDGSVSLLFTPSLKLCH